MSLAVRLIHYEQVIVSNVRIKNLHTCQKTRIKILSMAVQTIISQFRVPVLLIPTELAERKKQVCFFYETFLKKSYLEIERI